MIEEAATLISQRITEDQYIALANTYSIEWAALMAFVSVESNGKPFYKTGEPVILFEGRHFSRLTSHVFDKEYPTISHKAKIRTYYDMPQFPRLEKAFELNPEAALMSASWGAMQVMGFNFEMVGYDDVFEYVRDMYISEYYHIKAGCEYIKQAGLLVPLRQKKWVIVAEGYNGKEQAKWGYDRKFKQEYDHWSVIQKQRGI